MATGTTDGQPGAPPRMSAWQKSVFGFGSAAFGIKDGGFNTFLLIFYNQVLGVPATLVSGAIATALIFDAVADPFIGALSDNWRSSLGRRHPFMYASAVPVALLYFLIWNPPALTGSAMFFYLLGISILLRVAVACYEIPSVALVAEISRDYDERTSILSFRLFFQIIIPAAVGIITLTTFMANTPAHPNGILNRDGYLPYALFASVVMLASILVSSFGTRSRIPYLRKAGSDERQSLMTILRQTFEALTNPAFLTVTVAGFFSAMNAGIGNNLGTYLGLYFWRFTPQQLSVLVVAGLLSTIIALPLSPYLSRRFGKKRAGIFLAVVWLLLNNIVPVMKLQGLLPPDGSTALLVIFFVNTLVTATLIICCVILIVSMITDVNEDNELRTGRRSEGVFAAANSFVSKTTSGIGVLLAGVLIDLVHFPAHATPQTLDPQIIRNLVMVYLPTQFVLLSFTIFFLSRYRIDRTAHEDNLKRLLDAAAVEGEAASLIDTPKLG